jgi:hypothetical protein
VKLVLQTEFRTHQHVLVWMDIIEMMITPVLNVTIHVQLVLLNLTVLIVQESEVLPQLVNAHLDGMKMKILTVTNVIQNVLNVLLMINVVNVIQLDNKLFLIANAQLTNMKQKN